MRIRALYALIALWFVGACGSPLPASLSRADVTVTVRPDGSIQVRESLTVPATATGDSRFERRIPLERAESLTFEAASLDGTPVERGSALEVNEGDGLVVTWSVPASVVGTHVFELQYRAHGALAVRGSRGVIRQVALPSDRSYAIDHATVRLAVDPELHRFEGAGIAEAGWSVSRTGDGIAGERSSVPAHEGATFMAEVGIVPGSVVEPEWQRYEAWSRDLIPAWISGGLFMLVIGAGVLWIIRFQYPRRKRGTVPLTDAEDRERAAVRSGLRTSGMVSVVLSGVLAVVTWLTLSHFGWWPMSLPVSILTIGAVFLLVAKRIV